MENAFDSSIFVKSPTLIFQIVCSCVMSSGFDKLFLVALDLTGNQRELISALNLYKTGDL